MANLTLLLACVALAAGFAFLAIHSARRCSRILTEMRGTVSSIASLRGKVEAHDSELEAVTDSIRQLRGKFYAERRKSLLPGTSSEQEEALTPGNTVDVAALKAQLRRKSGLVAGRPAPHA